MAARKVGSLHLQTAEPACSSSAKRSLQLSHGQGQSSGSIDQFIDPSAAREPDESCPPPGRVIGCAPNTAELRSLRRVGIRQAWTWHRPSQGRADHGGRLPDTRGRSAASAIPARRAGPSTVAVHYQFTPDSDSSAGTKWYRRCAGTTGNPSPSRPGRLRRRVRTFEHVILSGAPIRSPVRDDYVACDDFAQGSSWTAGSFHSKPDRDRRATLRSRCGHRGGPDWRRKKGPSKRRRASMRYAIVRR